MQYCALENVNDKVNRSSPESQVSFPWFSGHNEKVNSIVKLVSGFMGDI